MTMQFDLVSDLHLECRYYDISTSGRVLVVAGDVCNGSSIKPHLKTEMTFERSNFQSFFDLAASQYDHVLYVLGNHEFYGLEMTKAYENVKRIVKPNVTVLNDDYIIIDKVLYIGGTLWTDCFKHNHVSMSDIEFGMNDFKKIKVNKFGNYRKFRARDMVDIHSNTLNYFRNQLGSVDKNNGDIEKIVVVSHHAPTFNSIPKEYRGNSLNAAYASDLSDFILDNEIDVWTHGHIHDKIDYMIGDTRVVANPRGYYGYETMAKDYSPMTVIL